MIMHCVSFCIVFHKMVCKKSYEKPPLNDKLRDMLMIAGEKPDIFARAVRECFRYEGVVSVSDISAKLYDMGFRQIRRDVGTGRIDNHPEIENLVPRKRIKAWI